MQVSEQSSHEPATHRQGVQVAEGSTVIDMTGAQPVLVRLGKGDPALFMLEDGSM